MDLGISGLGEATYVNRGGNAIVYRARDLDLDRDVAIKVMAGVGDEAAMRRFQREGRAMSRLPPHPGIAMVFSSGVTATGEPYLLMPFYDRGSYGALVDQGVAWPWRDAVTIMIIVSDAIAHAHQHGVLHRDLKPDNIMRDDQERPVVVDFGIANLLDETQSASLALTPAYAPPESFERASDSPTSDIYALGATLHALLLGGSPFDIEDKGIWEAIQVVRAEQPIPLGADVPKSVCRVIERAMAKDFNYRYSEAVSFRDDLQRVLAAPDTFIEVPTKEMESAGAAEPVSAPWASATAGVAPGTQPSPGSFGPDIAVDGGARSAARSMRSRLALAAAVATLIISGAGALFLIRPADPAEKDLVEAPAREIASAATPGATPAATPTGAAAPAGPTPETAGSPSVADGCLPVLESCMGSDFGVPQTLLGLAADASFREEADGKVLAQNTWRLGSGLEVGAWGDQAEIVHMWLNAEQGPAVDVGGGLTVGRSVFSEALASFDVYDVHTAWDSGSFLVWASSCIQSGAEIHTVTFFGRTAFGNNELFFDPVQDWVIDDEAGNVQPPLIDIVADLPITSVSITSPAFDHPWPACGPQEPYSWCVTASGSLNVRAEPGTDATVVANVAEGSCTVYLPDASTGSTIEPVMVRSGGFEWHPVVVADQSGAVSGWVAIRFIEPNVSCATEPICR